MLSRRLWLPAALVLAATLAVRAQAPLPPGPVGPVGPPPPATIQLFLIKGSYIVGVTGGEGALYFQGRTYPLSVGGVSFGLSIGGSTADLVGEVYGLTSPYDIEGVYGAAKTSYAVAGGESAIILRNTRGVELHLRGKQIGLEISLDLSGLSISLD